MAEARADCRVGFLGCCRRAGFCGWTRIRCGPCVESLAVGADADFWFCCWGPRAADGAVRFRRQVGLAIAAASGGNEPHAASGLCLLDRDRTLAEKTLSVGRGD